MSDLAMRSPQWTASDASDAMTVFAMSDEAPLRYSDAPDDVTTFEYIAIKSDELSYYDGSDFFPVHLSINNGYMIYASGTYTPYIVLFDSNGYLLTPEEDDSTDFGEYSTRAFTVPESGAYYIGVTWRYMDGEYGTYTLGLAEDIADDGQRLGWVEDENRSPDLRIAIPTQEATEGKTWRYTIPATTFTDPDGDSLTFTATQSNGRALPSWLRFNGATGKFAATKVPKNAPNLTVKVTAEDPSGETALTTFTLRTPAASKRKAGEMASLLSEVVSPLSGSAATVQAGHNGGGIIGLLAAAA